MQRDSELVCAIHEHWVLSGVEVDVANDMADELADHLTAAIADGKTVEHVVGSDLRQFADQWAESHTQSASARRRATLIALSAAMFASANVASDALVGWDTRVSVNLFTTGLAALIGGAFAATIAGPRLSRVRRTGLRSNTQLVLTIGLIAGLLITCIAWAVNTFPEGPTITLPTWVAVAATAITFTVTLGPLVAMFANVQRTDGWAKRIANLLDAFL